MNRFSDAEKQKCAEREVKWRIRVYSNRVHVGRMTAEEADYQIEIMKAIAEDYRAKAELPLLRRGQ